MIQVLRIISIFSLPVFRMISAFSYHVMVLDRLARKKDYFLILVYPITTHDSTFYRWRRLKA
jgi:hypothetical protein